MDSSSDGSFAWTDASNDTSNSGDIINGAMNKGDTENESESGKSYKKKLQNELFAEINGSAKNEEQLNKHKDRKRKLSERHSDSERIVTPKKKKIKKESESDMDPFVTTANERENIDAHNGSDSYDEKYLNSKVKVEQHFATPSPTKVKKKRNKTMSNSDNLNEESFDKLDEPKNLNDDHFSEKGDHEEDKLNVLVEEENEYHESKSKKKKKKSKRKDSTMFNDTETKQCSFQEVDALEEENVTLILSDDNSPNNTTRPIVQLKEKKIKNRNKLTSPNVDDDAIEQAEKVSHDLEPPVNKNVSFNVQNETSKRKPRISDRIQFEDDESSNVDPAQSENEKASAKSNKMKHFLKNNSNLKPFASELETQSVLTADDEIWLIRCPRDVDVNAFHSKHFTLEGKCKLKLNGQTYEGIVDDVSGNVSVLSSEHNNYVIKSLSVRGCVSLRKRIPKSQVHGGSGMTNNQTNFIPLPETKCRHPLFGSNYKKAIKLTAAVAQRLRHAPDDDAPRSAPGHRKTSKRGGDAASPAVSETSAQPSVKPEQESHHTASEPSAQPSVKPEHESHHTLTNTNKKKKRKHDDQEYCESRKAKRRKRNLECASAWESEQAIEENLFDF